MRPGLRKGGGQGRWRAKITSARDITVGPGPGIGGGGPDRGEGGPIPEIGEGDQDPGTDLGSTKNTNGSLEAGLEVDLNINQIIIMNVCSEDET